MNIELKELYQELVIDHGTKPRNYCAMPNATHSADGFNPLCGDKIKLHLCIANDTILKASFEGQGCAISTAAASIMTEMLIGKNKTEAYQLFTEFKALITQDGESKATLGKLLALASVKNFPSRVKCATLAWHTLDAALRNAHDITTTEAI